MLKQFNLTFNKMTMLKFFFGIVIFMASNNPTKSYSQTWSKFGWPSDTLYITETLYDSANQCTYLCGAIRRFNGNVIGHVMKWDGNNFTKVGDGFNSSVSSLAIFNDTLYACGAFTFSGTTNFNFPFAKWDGNNWQEVESAFSAHDNAHPTLPALLNTLKVYHNRLYIGGEFVSNNNPQLGNLAYWDGVNIKAGYCIGSTAVTNHDMKIVVFKDEMYILSDYCLDTCPQRNVNYGTYDGIIKYDTICKAAMVAYSTPFPIGISAIYATDSLLYIGHYSAIPQGSFISAFDGVNLIPLAQGLNAPVHSINSYNGKIIVGGVFNATSNNSISLPHIALWDGISWSQLPSNCVLNGNIWALNKLDNYILASGNFHDCSLDTNINWSAIYPASINTSIDEIVTKRKDCLKSTYLNEIIRFNFSCEVEKSMVIRVYSSIGNLVKQFSLDLDDKNGFDIDKLNFSDGMYVLVCEGKNGKKYTCKFIVS